MVGKRCAWLTKVLSLAWRVKSFASTKHNADSPICNKADFTIGESEGLILEGAGDQGTWLAKQNTRATSGPDLKILHYK